MKSIECETPKSPPGDYNDRPGRQGFWRQGWRVKHLNPRQGITTGAVVLHRQPCQQLGVKHLNPRQGITISDSRALGKTRALRRVKHLNPRQGITIRRIRHSHQSDRGQV